MTRATADRAAVLSALLAIEKLLQRHEVSYLSVVRELRERVETVEGSELAGDLRLEVRRMFGGMGSLNDVYIAKVNGHHVDDEDHANRRLDELQNVLFTLVADLEDES